MFPSRSRFVAATLVLALVIPSLSAWGANDKGSRKNISSKNNQDSIKRSQAFERRNRARLEATAPAVPTGLAGPRRPSTASTLIQLLLLSQSLISITGQGQDRVAPERGPTSLATKNPSPVAMANNMSAVESLPCRPVTIVGPLGSTGVPPLPIITEALAAKETPAAERNPRNKFWAQDMVKAELMKKKVDHLLTAQNMTNVVVPVAVLDSGIYTEVISSINSEGLVQEKVMEGRGKTRSIKLKVIFTPIKLPNGRIVYSRRYDKMDLGDKTYETHGTSVTGLIAAKDGVGMVDGGVKLTVYPYSLSNFDYMSDLLETICQENRDPDGVAIINMSMGSSIDQAATIFGKALGGIFFQRDEDYYRPTMKKLAEMGCLIVKSSGNSAYRGEHINDLDDAYLRVEAVDHLKRRADFSSVGEVSAPGKDVWTITSPRNEFALSRWLERWALGKKSLCKKEGGTTTLLCMRTSGTSFSAPIVSGIAAQVVRVLKSRPYFKALPPEERIKVVNRILKNSEVEGVVNGYEAVELANSWNEVSAEKKGPLPPSFIKGLL